MKIYNTILYHYLSGFKNYFLKKILNWNLQPQNLSVLYDIALKNYTFYTTNHSSTSQASA
jgi:hypothetical protein